MLNQFNQSLWGDEGFSAILSMRSLPEIIKTIISDTSPPLWNFFEWIVFNTLGTDEIYIRFLAFVFFLGTVFFTYKIGEHLFNKRTGLIAAGLTFLNPFFFIYAFEGRMYSILALGVTASMYFFLKRSWLPYVIATAWAMYSHHFAIFAVFLQGLWFIKEYFWGKRKIAVQMFKAFVVVGILYIPWIYPLYNQVRMVGGGFWLGTPTFLDLLGLLGKYLGAGIEHPLRIVALGLTLSVLILRRWTKNSGTALFLLSWFLVPILLTWIVSQFFQSIFFDRYLLYTIPAAMLIIASNQQRLSKILIWLMAISYAIIAFYYFTHPTKIPFRDLAAYVQETKQEGDFLINEDAGSHKLWESKYYGIPAPIYVPSGEELPFFVGTALMEEGDTIQEIPNAKRLGVITFKEGAELKFPGFITIVEKRFGDLNFVWMKRD